jgi:hypothetical protein
MLREDECVMNEDIGVIRNDKIFRMDRKRIVAKREGEDNERKERDTSVALQIK